MLKMKAVEIAQNLRIEDFVISSGWLDRFNTRTVKAAQFAIAYVLRLQYYSTQSLINPSPIQREPHIKYQVWTEVSAFLGEVSLYVVMTRIYLYGSETWASNKYN